MARRKRDSQSRSKRNFRQRDLKPLVCCVAEGKTEKEYVSALVRKKYGSSVKIVFPGRASDSQSSLKNHLKQARELLKEYKLAKSCWIICDIDKNLDHRADFEAWVGKNPDKHRAAFSHPSIELWFLSHFEKPIGCRTETEATKRLNNHLRGYRKGDRQQLEGLVERTSIAIENNKMLGKTPTVDEIFNQKTGTQIPTFIYYLDKQVGK